MPLQGIDDIHGSDSLPLGMLGVGDSVPDDVLKEDLEDTSGLLIDEARDTLDTTTARQTADGGLGDALDVVPEDLPVALGASLAESLASFAASSHDDASSNFVERMMSVGVGGRNLWGEKRAKAEEAVGESPLEFQFISLPFSTTFSSGQRRASPPTRNARREIGRWRGEHTMSA